MSRIVAIASGKGGVGKTWLSIGLAQALARFDRRVLLFDADLGLANVDIQLGLCPERDLGTVLGGRCRLIDAIAPFASGGFDLIAGRSGSGRLAGIGRARLGKLLDELCGMARRYDWVLLDLPAGVDEGVRRLLGAAERCLVVTTDEPTALTDAYVLIKTGRRNRSEGAFEIVVNLASSEAAGRRTYFGLRRVCERFLGFEPPLAGVLRHDMRVPEAIRQQMPFLSRHPTSPAARDLEALAGRLVTGA